MMRPSLLPRVLCRRNPPLYTPLLSRLQPIRNHAAPYSSSSPSPSPAPFNPETYLNHARQKFASQQPTLIHDTLSPTPSHLLTLSLADHIPSLFSSSSSSSSQKSPSSSLIEYPRPAETGADLTLPQGHHMVYFPLQLPPSQLMPDGTDPGHCPGEPFVRRMWAGGSVEFRPGWGERLKMDGRRAVCLERVVGEPVLKGGGVEGGEKVFVDVRRLYGDEEGMAGRDGEGAMVEEVRRLVFMREPAGVAKGVVGQRVVRASATPEFTFSLKPDATLLFHFSALTYNAHAIHIDPDYARNEEGYKGLLVHGPLTLVLMLSALRACLARVQTQAGALSQSQSATPEQQTPSYVKSLNYRNLAPLYVNEEMKVCLRRTKAEGDELGWDVWMEGPEGGLAVRGRAVTTSVAEQPQTRV